jgi:hypothetical protein
VSFEEKDVILCAVLGECVDGSERDAKYLEDEEELA